MTNNQHGQVPEALIDLIDAYAETRHRCGGIYNAKTEAARKAVIEALSGVKAPSAAPGVTSEQRRLIGVIADKIEDGTLFQSGIYPKKDLARFVRNMLDTTPTAPAASPTPPAEQQAAHKTAPGVGNSVFDHQTAADFLSGKTVSDEAVRKFVAASRWAHDERAALSATLLAMHGVLTSREAEIALLKKALLEAEAAPKAAPGGPSDVEIDDFLDSPACITWVIASNRDRYRLLVRAVLAKWAAPQQEAQESAHPSCKSDMTVNGGALKLALNVLRRAGKTEVADELEKTAQPAPAPLSDDVVRDAARYQWLRRWKGQEHEPPFTVQHEIDGTLWGGDLDAAIDAALAARGGK